MTAREFQWAADLLDIKQAFKDPGTCAWGTFCPCVLFGRNVNRITDGQTSFMKACLTDLALGGCLCWCCCLPFYAAPFREQLRKKKNLPMDPYSDIHTHMFFHPCALCQEERVLDATESAPMSAPAQATIDRHPAETKIHLEEVRTVLEEPRRIRSLKMTRNNSF